MANIREYESQFDTLQPSSKASSATAGFASSQVTAAKEKGAMFGQIIADAGSILQKRKDEADKAAKQKELMTAYRGWAAINSNLDAGWDELARSTDPHDIGGAAAKYEEDGNAKIDAWQESIQDPGNQMWALERSVAMREKLHRTTQADVLNISNATLNSDFEGAIDDLSNAVRKNPDTVEDALASLPGVVSGIAQNSNMSATDSAKFVTETQKKAAAKIISAGIQGEIEMKSDANRDGIPDGPDIFLQRYAAGDYDQYADILGNQSVNGMPTPALVVFEKYAIAQNELNQRAIEAAKTSQEKIEKDRIEAAATKLWAITMPNEKGVPSIDGTYWTGPGSLEEISRMPGITAAQLEAIKDRGEAIQNKTTARTNDPTVFEDLKKRIITGEATTFDIARAVADGTIKAGQDGEGILTNLLTAVKANDPIVASQKDFDRVLGAYKSSFTATDIFKGISDYSGDLEYSQFMTDTQQEFDYRVAHGESADDLLDHKSPHFLFRDFKVGKIKSIPVLDAVLGILGGAGPSWEVWTGNVPEDEPVVVPPAIQYQPGQSMEDLLKQIEDGPSPGVERDPTEAFDNPDLKIPINALSPKSDTMSRKTETSSAMRQPSATVKSVQPTSAKTNINATKASVTSQPKQSAATASDYKMGGFGSGPNIITAKPPASSFGTIQPPGPNSPSFVNIGSPAPARTFVEPRQKDDTTAPRVFKEPRQKDDTTAAAPRVFKEPRQKDDSVAPQKIASFGNAPLSSFLSGIADMSTYSTFDRGGLAGVSGLVFHTTGSLGEAGDVVGVLNQRGMGVHYVIDRRGTIFKTLPEAARGAHIYPSGNGLLDNSNTIGIEVIGKDDGDILPAQVKASRELANGLVQQYALDKNAIFGHGELKGDKRQTDEAGNLAMEVRMPNLRPRPGPLLAEQKGRPKGTAPIPPMPIGGGWAEGGGLGIATKLTNFEDPFTSGKLSSGLSEKYASRRAPVVIRNNNVAAISLGKSSSWVQSLPGYIGKTKRPAAEGGYYAKFATPEAGVAAASKLLERYGSKGVDTPYEIVRKWSTDSTQWPHYAGLITKYTGVAVDEPLDLTDPQVRAEVIQAMSAHESGIGKPIYETDVFVRGANYELG